MLPSVRKKSLVFCRDPSLRLPSYSLFFFLSRKTYNSANYHSSFFLSTIIVPIALPLTELAPNGISVQVQKTGKEWMELGWLLIFSYFHLIWFLFAHASSVAERTVLGQTQGAVPADILSSCSRNREAGSEWTSRVTVSVSQGQKFSSPPKKKP